LSERRKSRPDGDVVGLSEIVRIPTCPHVGRRASVRRMRAGAGVVEVVPAALFGGAVPVLRSRR
jgi:hypothetical protein